MAASIACDTMQGMASLARLIAAIRNNPKGVRFDDACKVAVAMGFATRGGKGFALRVRACR